MRTNAREVDAFTTCCYCFDMKNTSKKDLAISFLADLANMNPGRLQEIVRTTIGEELAEVMFNYAREVIKANPKKILENASSMLILGYLIRAHEEGYIPPENLPV